MEALKPLLVLVPSMQRPVRIWALADIHLGNVGCHKERLRQDLQRIKDDPQALWLGLGDLVDFISPGDPRFDAETVDGNMVSVRDYSCLGGKLMRYVGAMLEPIKARGLALGTGNHEQQYLSRHAQMDCMENLCQFLGLQNARYSSFLHVYFEHRAGLRALQVMRDPAPVQLGRKGQKLLRIATHHGFGAAATPGGKMAMLAKLQASFTEIDWIVCGHLHEALAKTFTRLTMEDGQVQERIALVSMTGSYLRGSPSGCTAYSERKGYAPTTLGAIHADYVPASGELSVTQTMQGAGQVF